MPRIFLVPLMAMLATLASAEGLRERVRTTPLPEPPAAPVASAASAASAAPAAPVAPVASAASAAPAAPVAPAARPVPVIREPESIQPQDPQPASLPAAGPRRPSFQEALLRADRPLVAAHLAEGADPAGAFADGSIPLIAAVFGGDRPIASRLLDAGAPADGQDLRGDTPLIVAARRGRADLVEFLLGRGADAHLANSRGETAGAAAAAAGASDALRWLRAVDDEQTRAGLMREAVGQGEVDRVSTLLRLGAHPDTAAPDGRTALLAAAEAGRLDVARQLVQRRADVNRATREGATALMVMQRSSGPGRGSGAGDAAELARLLIEAGADVNARDRYGHSVLMWAEEFGNRDVIALLEGSGARR